MIRKITVNEYLKRLDNMNGEERQKYNERVGKWLRNIATRKLTGHINDPDAQLQNVLQCSTGWNDTECHTFEEGALLMTAVVHSEETWLPDMLYTKSAKRVIRRMVEVLKSLPLTPPKEEGKQENVMFTVKPGPHVTVSPDAKSTTTTQIVAPFGDAKGQAPDNTKLKPVRPRHIDQYIHLLPAKTQEHAAQVKELLRELDESRETMRKLMDDNTVGAAVREAWAKKVTGIDNKIRKIYDELDAEWDKLVKQGRVVLDDLGNAHIVECPADEGAPQPAPELTKEQKAKRKNLRKWLCDMRYGNGATREDYVKRWRENFKEYLSLQGDTAFDDEKVQTAAKHYEITLEELRNTNV